MYTKSVLNLFLIQKLSRSWPHIRIVIL